MPAHNETLAAAAMSVGNKYGLPVAIHSCDTAPTPTGFAETVSDGLPVPFHGCFPSQSFWKAGSARNGSQNGSSLRRDAVTGPL